jgi:hypothetical protein
MATRTKCRSQRSANSGPQWHTMRRGCTRQPTRARAIMTKTGASSIKNAGQLTQHASPSLPEDWRLGQARSPNHPNPSYIVMLSTSTTG